jgi:hypothetical protein
MMPRDPKRSEPTSKKKRRKHSAPMSRTRKPPDDFGTGEHAINPHLKETILEVVENQLRAKNPPETRQTLERLLAAGYTRTAAVERIGSALVEEIWQMLHEQKPYNPVRFKAALDKLA